MLGMARLRTPVGLRLSEGADHGMAQQTLFSFSSFLPLPASTSNKAFRVALGFFFFFFLKELCK